MPSRVIREGWVESEKIDMLDAGAERFFLRLCLRADDFGRYNANPALLRSNLFPLRDDVRSTDIPRWLAACEKAGLVRTYEVTGKRYVEIHKFEQRMRAAVSKFPAPAEASPSDAGHLSGKCQTDDGPPRSEAESEAESESKTDAEAESEKGRGQKTAIQLRAEKLHGKRATTPWDKAEIAAWKSAQPVVAATTEEEWLLLEAFYAEPQEKTYARKSLATTLNNWSGEISRAREWAKRNQSGWQPPIGDF